MLKKKKTQAEAQALERLNAYYAEFREYPGHMQWTLKPEDLITGRALLNVDDQRRTVLIRVALCHFPSSKSGWPSPLAGIHNALLKQLITRRKLPYTVDDIKVIFRAMGSVNYIFWLSGQSLLRSLAHSLADQETLAACRPDIERLRSIVGTWYPSAEQRKFCKLLDDILGGQQKRAISIANDEWGAQVSTLLQAMQPDMRERWLALLDHCSTTSDSTPSNKWLTQVPALIEALGKDTFCQLAITWLDAFGKHRGNRLDEGNATLLRGLAWSCSDAADSTLVASLADAAIEGYRKIPGLGPRSARIASASVFALKHMPNLHSAAQLDRVRLSVKQQTYLKEIEKALDEAARRAGMSREDLEELTVPTFGLDQGRLRYLIGPTMVELQIAGQTAQLQWYDATGNVRKSEPAAIKREYKAERKDLKRLCDDITRMLTAQRDRLERLTLSERQWLLTAWRERYLDHPVISCIAKRLIWRFSDGKQVQDGIWLEGQLVDADDRPLALSASTIVSAWHPVLCNADAVLSWRNCLERHQITQPFKQAHREIYLLTDAERNTRIYSNRFAAHILRQHQFNALAAARGWRNSLRLMVDDSYPPATLELPHWGLRAEFWIEGSGDEYGVDTNHTGTYLHVTTDQVRFYAIDACMNHADAGGGGYHPVYNRQERRQNEAPVPIPLEEIPALVFSEVLRDVDLFVGVASVGNDPTWQDGGPRGRYRDYWHAYSFGELSATAETRKQLLERLIPRLTLADRCHIEGRFLKVRGDLRTYKIHLGSGNILMEPNDQYLCIVPGRGESGTAPTEQLYLPFKGDNVLSIILSKAFLLAEDTNITDPTITRQIGMAGNRV